MTDVVVFIDALSPRELSGPLKEMYQGDLDAGTPRVTPKVMSSVYTGTQASENGILAKSKYSDEEANRPKQDTIFEDLVNQDKTVLCMNMPYCIPFNLLEVGNSMLHGTSPDDVDIKPEESAQILHANGPIKDLITDNPDSCFASYFDTTQVQFNKFKEAIRAIDPDVAFLGYRKIDSYCHFQHTEERDGKAYRQHLIDEVSGLCDRIRQHIDGDLMFFSDHGQTKKTDVFRINQWLANQGYLSYKVDYDFVEQNQCEDPQAARVTNQTVSGQPGVYIDEEESQVICDDPYDTCITLLCDRSEFDGEQFRKDLMDTGLYRSVDYKWNIYDESDDMYNSVPDVIPDRKKGVFVTGNLHEQPIGMGYHRTGVHDFRGCYGSTKKLDVPDPEGRDGCITPVQMNEIIWDFIGGKQ